MNRRDPSSAPRPQFERLIVSKISPTPIQLVKNLVNAQEIFERHRVAKPQQFFRRNAMIQFLG